MSWLTSDRIAEVRDYVEWWNRQWPKPLSASGSDFDEAEIGTTLAVLSDWLEEKQIDASPLRNFNRQPRNELVDNVLNLLERAESLLERAEREQQKEEAAQKTPSPVESSGRVERIAKEVLAQALRISPTELRNRLKSGEIKLAEQPGKFAKYVKVDVNLFPDDTKAHILKKLGG